jgi:hypothetical protein
LKLYGNDLLRWYVWIGLVEVKRGEDCWLKMFVERRKAVWANDDGGFGSPKRMDCSEEMTGWLLREISLMAM